MELGNTQLSPLWEVVVHPRSTVHGADFKKNELGFVSIDIDLPVGPGLINSAHFASDGMVRQNIVRGEITKPQL